MQLKPLASTIALAAALAISGPVAAQSMINGMTIPEDELPVVQQHCDDLKNAADTVSESAEEPVGQADPDPEADASALEDAVTTIDLDTVDLQACIDAGLVTE